MILVIWQEQASFLEGITSLPLVNSIYTVGSRPLLPQQQKKKNQEESPS